MKLAANMASAWLDRLIRAARVLEAAAKAPGLFKPDTVEQARRDFDQARREGGRWRS